MTITIAARPTQRPGVFDSSLLGSLLSPTSVAHNDGPVKWAPTRTLQPEGTVMVFYEGIIRLQNGRYIMRINSRRPYMQFFTYIVNDVAVRRACINQPHQGITYPVHVHSYLADGREKAEEADTLFPYPKIEDKIDLDLFRQSAEYFAQMCSINLTDSWWVAPDLPKFPK